MHIRNWMALGHDVVAAALGLRALMRWLQQDNPAAEQLRRELAERVPEYLGQSTRAPQAEPRDGRI